jgi:hypothetical protein
MANELIQNLHLYEHLFRDRIKLTTTVCIKKVRFHSCSERLVFPFRKKRRLKIWKNTLKDWVIIWSLKIIKMNLEEGEDQEETANMERCFTI